MSVKIENLHVGEFIAVTQDYRDIPGRFRVADFPGRPMEVIGISPPFVAVQAPGEHPITIDLRAWGVSKLDEAYVDAWIDRWLPEPPKKKRRRRPKPDERDCQRCGQRMVQKLLRGQWRHVCPECGLDKGPVGVTA